MRPSLRPSFPRFSRRHCLIRRRRRAMSRLERVGNLLAAAEEEEESARRGQATAQSESGPPMSVGHEKSQLGMGAPSLSLCARYCSREPLV